MSAVLELRGALKMALHHLEKKRELVKRRSSEASPGFDDYPVLNRGYLALMKTEPTIKTPNTHQGDYEI